MSAVRRYFREVGRQMRNDFPADIENVRNARRIGQFLQSFDARLGFDVHDIERGAVRFGNRWYFPESREQSNALVNGDASVTRLRSALKARISERLAAHTSGAVETDDHPRPTGRINI